MKFANWSSLYTDDTSNETLDKAAKKVIDVTVPDHDEEQCIRNIKEKKDLVFISV